MHELREADHQRGGPGELVAAADGGETLHALGEPGLIEQPRDDGGDAQHAGAEEARRRDHGEHGGEREHGAGHEPRRHPPLRLVEPREDAAERHEEERGAGEHGARR